MSDTAASPASRSGRRGGYDPDRVAALEEELAQQLASLKDLDAEFEAGDLDEDDYRTLSDDYTVRVADTMRRLRSQEALVAERRRRFTPLTIAAVVVFAIGAGFLLARSVGERGVNGVLTGETVSPRQRIFECQELAAQGEIVPSLECLDEVLARDPDNAEALTYRGWYLVLTTGSAEDEQQAAGLLDAGLTYLDRAVEVEPDFIDARAFRAVVFDRLGQSAIACSELSVLLSLDPPPFFVQQTADIAARNNCG
ncbi:MAG: hypothetical protein AAF547_18340 [Actinomycetota bacterium]